MDNMARIRELVSEITTLLDEAEAQNQMTPEQKKQKEKDDYIKMNASEREMIDRKKLGEIEE